MLSAQVLVTEGTWGIYEFGLDTLVQIRFAELDPISNEALSIHTANGIRHFPLSEIDYVDIMDSLNISVNYNGKQSTIRRADIDLMEISPVTLPDRDIHARSGSQFMRDILDMSFNEREPLILQEILNGNMPDIARKFITCTSTFYDTDGVSYIVEYDVMTDYLSIGTNEDYCRVPMGPKTAQQIADAFGCILTTRKLCDDIWGHATVRLNPIPYMPVGDNNTKVYKFVEHNTDINNARAAAGGQIFELIAGIKKDVVICNALKTRPGYVAIYGWHYTSGSPIQPLYTGHIDYYVDYSHGIRLVNEVFRVNGVSMSAHDMLRDAKLYKLLSDESEPMQQTRYTY
ncbi:MAG: hypothetical protein K0B52_00125 [FCB group bacterium]|nr:hypothetical protein [FCB group bacterium]